MLTEPRFIVAVNGTQRCVAGFDGYAVLSATFSLVLMKPRPGLPEIPAFLRPVSFCVGGRQGRDHVDWLVDDLVAGNEVTVRVSQGGPVDSTVAAELGPEAEAARRAVDRMRARMASAGNVEARRLQVAVNDHEVCTAGVESGVISITLTWARRDPAEMPPFETGANAEEWENGRTELHVGGLENDEHLSWHHAYVDVGEEVRVQVLGPGPIDAPQIRRKRLQIPHEDQTVMSGRRITLRKLVDDDLDFLAAMLGDAEVMRYWPKPMDRVEAEQWLRRQQQRYVDDGCGYWLVVDNETLKPVGQVGVIMTEVDGRRIPSLGYMIHRPFWRQGYGAEGAWMCVHWVEHALKETTVYTLVRPENEPSLALARRIGMKPLRTVEHAGFEHVLMALDRPV